jgi:CRP-like cAMP-binding protein
MESMRERNCRSQVNRAVEFFRKLPSSALEDFRLLEHQSSYAANVVLFAEGEPVRALFAILEGEVRLSINSSEGKRLILRIAREGDIIGLSSTLSGTPYDMTAETLYSSKIAPIERREFLNFLARHPDAYQSVTDELGRHMTMACSQLRTIVVSIQRDGASRTAALELPKLEHRRYSAPLHRKPESFHRKSTSISSRVHCGDFSVDVSNCLRRCTGCIGRATLNGSQRVFGACSHRSGATQSRQAKRCGFRSAAAHRVRCDRRADLWQPCPSPAQAAELP